MENSAIKIDVPIDTSKIEISNSKGLSLGDYTKLLDSIPKSSVPLGTPVNKK